MREGWMKGRVVESWETKTVVESDKSGGGDSWEQNWSDEEEEGQQEQHEVNQQLEGEAKPKGDSEEGKATKENKGKEKELSKSSLLLSGDEEEEDASGWGLDEDLDLDVNEPPPETPVKPEAEAVEKPETVNDDDDAPPQIEEMDWGEWGEDDNTGNAAPVKQEVPPTPPPEKRKKEVAKKNPPTPKTPTLSTNKRRKKSSSPKQIVSRETYTITGMPDAILAIITQLLDEAVQLATNPKYTSTPIAPASREMLALPRLILAAYRALAPIYYSVDLTSKMYLSNDCIYISTRLPELAGSATAGPNGKKLFERFSLEGESAGIAAFGKRQQAREVEAQKTILRDYLDGTQGLVACTEYPQSETCEAAIKAVVDRVRLLEDKWRGVLSQRALWTVLGSLLATVCGKVLSDVGDMSDISDPESRKLAGLMGEVARLEDLFLPPPPPGGEEGSAVPCTAVYCGNWLKFRYLESIMECTMIELLEMYNAGQLEEFEREELEELVRALFADTENRRRCLESIRRGPTGVVSGGW